jgi:hypothetical protein
MKIVKNKIVKNFVFIFLSTKAGFLFLNISFSKIKMFSVEIEKNILEFGAK